MDGVRALGKELSNWGRWGAEDERGTVNLISPRKLVEAGGLIRQGRIFSLSLDFDGTGPQSGGGGRFNPIHTMMRDGADDLAGVYAGEGFRYADDVVFMPLQCSTQWDALSHVWYDGQLYNGFPAQAVTSAGASRNGIGALAAGVASRGVLLDIPRLKGMACLPATYGITTEDLDAASAAEGVLLGEGDVLVLRTGAMGQWRREQDTNILMRGTPGLSPTCLRWLHAHGIAAVAADNQTVEPIMPASGQPPMMLHMVGIRDLGLLLGEFFWLDDLAEDCAADGVYEFFFTAAPLKFPKAVGSPINPLAIK